MKLLRDKIEVRRAYLLGVFCLVFSQWMLHWLLLVAAGVLLLFDVLCMAWDDWSNS